LQRGNVFFLGEIPNKDIHIFYRHALVHVLPSLRESPGLVSLEALANGCKIVVSNNMFAPCDTYFKGMASFCNPLSAKDIRDKILQEIKTERDSLQNIETIKSQFSWKNTAEETYKAYCSILQI
jgi:glycosyltransferase involved in cell wall biosynthesis